MLILTRRVGESLIVADDVKITIRIIHKNKVKLKIKAPNKVLNQILNNQSLLPKAINNIELSRNIGETLAISNDVKIIVFGVQGNQVRIGVNAPKNIPVHREEIYERIQKEKANGN